MLFILIYGQPMLDLKYLKVNQNWEKVGFGLVTCCKTNLFCYNTCICQKKLFNDSCMNHYLYQSRFSRKCFTNTFAIYSFIQILSTFQLPSLIVFAVIILLHRMTELTSKWINYLMTKVLVQQPRLHRILNNNGPGKTICKAKGTKRSFKKLLKAVNRIFI